MKPTRDECDEAANMLGALQYYPSDATARYAVSLMFESMVDEAEKLRWLVSTMINRVGVWRGTAELRGVYCTKFRAADGIDVYCVETPGFTALDSEAAYLLQYHDSKRKELEAARISPKSLMKVN